MSCDPISEHGQVGSAPRLRGLPAPLKNLRLPYSSVEKQTARNIHRTDRYMGSSTKFPTTHHFDDPLV